MAYVITVANQKGGVGKTQTAVNLAYALSQHGKRVLAVDTDAQASLTLYTGCDPMQLEEEQRTLHYGLFDGRAPQDMIVHLDDFDLLPSSIRLARRARELVVNPVRSGPGQLRAMLRKVHSDYDFIVIDTPPSLSDLFVNALTASDGVLIPIKTDRMSAYGFTDLLDTIVEVRTGPNPELELIGVLPTMYQKGYRVDEEVMEILRQESTGRFHLFSPVRRSTNFDKAFNDAVPTLKAFPQTPGISAYVELAQSILAVAAT